MTVSSLSTLAPSVISAPATGQTTIPSNSPTGNNPMLVQEAVTLSSEAAAVNSLGIGAAGPLYDATGLLQQLSAAGTLQGPSLSPSAGEDVASTVQAYQDMNVVATLPQSSATSGIYNASGVLSVDQNANWAQLLKQQPDLAATAIADSTAQGIVSQLP